MSDKDPRDKTPNYDLTTPDILVPRREPPPPPAPPRAVGANDKTAINRPVAPPPQGGAARPSSAPNRYDLTQINFGAPPVDEDEDVVRRHPTPAPQTTRQPAAQPAPPRRGIPVWAWLGLGAFVVLFLAGAAVAYWYFTRTESFTLRVLNAPPGAKVYIDDVPSGVPQRDGSIVVQGLRAAEPREVRVAQQGFAEWRTSVTGQAGALQDITVNMTPLQEPAKATLPPEIDYNGIMVLVGAGEFKMGNDGGAPDESPLHAVDLPAFYIDKLEVTNQLYGQFCEATSHARPVNPFWDLHYFENNPQMPVIGISYADAAAYADWAGKRLPTEAEWEKAASWGPGATAKRQYPWGDPADRSRANIGTDHPSDVGSYPAGASAYGALDMTGNAREWVNSNYGPYPGSSASSPNFGKGMKVARGGDFRADINFARSTSRLAVEPGFSTKPGDDKVGRSSLIGFRCAISAEDPRLKSRLPQTTK